MVSARRHIPHRVRWAVAVRQQFRCATCEETLPQEVNLDHKTPLCDGGADHVLNLQILCLPCHAKKTSAENAARNRGRSEYDCVTCGRTFSRHFLHEHLHRRETDGGPPGTSPRRRGALSASSRRRPAMARLTPTTASACTTGWPAP